MTLKIERNSNAQLTILRLIGRIQSEHVEELKTLIRSSGPNVALGLDDVTIIDLDSVRFLRICEVNGIELVHCSPYIREWMTREQDREG